MGAARHSVRHELAILKGIRGNSRASCDKAGHDMKAANLQCCVQEGKSSQHAAGH